MPMLSFVVVVVVVVVFLFSVFLLWPMLSDPAIIIKKSPTNPIKISSSF